MPTPYRLFTFWTLALVGLAAGAVDTDSIDAKLAKSKTPSDAKSPPHAPVKEAVGPYGQNPAHYRLTFAEEFEGDELNYRIWNDREWYDPIFPTMNYSVEEGMLKIWPQRDSSGNFFKRVINTDGKFYQKYGYFETEAKLPWGKGVWAGFWLYNHDHKESFRPEIDIVEVYPGGGPDSGWSGRNLRPTAYGITIWTGEPEVQGGFKMLQDIGDLSAKFHKYAVKWEPHKQTFYFDGKEVYSAEVSMPDRMYLLVDLMFGSASGDPDHTTPTGKKNSFEIKYVRAWQFKQAPE
jgi:beta-glucanase (GH16 family)